MAEGKRPYLHVYGDDYKTHDGTGVRDYIHVVDLARAHLMALDRARTVTGVETYNIGTGVGYSVLDVVKAFEAATGRTGLRRAVPAMSMPAMPIRRWRVKCWAGTHSTVWMRCAGMPIAGRP